MVHTVPFGFKKIGRYAGKDIVRASHPKVIGPNFKPDKNVIYFYTPHTIRTDAELKQVKEKFSKAGAEYYVECVWSKFTERCRKLGMRCIPSFYELGIEVPFPSCGRELFPIHFGRSAFYETLNLKHLAELFPFAEKLYKDKKGKFLITAGRLKEASAEELTKDYPFIDLKVFHPRAWVKDCLSHVGCNVTATESDAGPRLFTYAARMGIGTVFIGPYLKKNMGEPIEILKPYMYVAKSFEVKDIAEQVTKARAARGKVPISHKAVMDFMYKAMRKQGFKLQKLEFFDG